MNLGLESIEKVFMLQKLEEGCTNTLKKITVMSTSMKKYIFNQKIHKNKKSDFISQTQYDIYIKINSNLSNILTTWEYKEFYSQDTKK